MPSLKEIKGRIASVNSTRKITSAMTASILAVVSSSIFPLASAPREKGSPGGLHVKFVALWRFQCQHHQDDVARCRRVRQDHRS